jgi:AraC-like DNA-binding protein
MSSGQFRFAERSEERGAARSTAYPSAVHPAEFVARLRGFQLDLTQIDRGRFTADGIQARIGRTLLGELFLGRGVLQNWRSPERSITLAVKASEARVLWRGLLLRSSDVLMIGPAAGLELVSQAGFWVLAATFPEHDFRHAAESHGLNARFEALGMMLLRFQQDGPADQLRAAIRPLLSQALARPVAARATRSSHGKELLELAAGIAAGGTPIDLHQRSLERWQALDQAISAMKKRLPERFTVADLCRLTGTSERALRKAFVEHYTVPPGRLLKALRLNGVRQDLRRLAARGAKITDIANKWGFWHLGQFATDYRGWFDELPSETSRAGRTTT